MVAQLATQRKIVIVNSLFVCIICVGLLGTSASDSFANPKVCLAKAIGRSSSKHVYDAAALEYLVGESDVQSDVDRLIALRSHPLDEVVVLANQLETKWRGSDWNLYARIMTYVCSEISNRGLNETRVREQSEHFARVALSHSNMYLWEHEATLVGSLGYQRSSDNVDMWLRDRREKTELWLHALRRLEREVDTSFDVHDSKNLPSMRVFPPVETGLPAGSPPSAIKDPRLRAKYEAAIANNQRKSQLVEQQLSLQLHGPSFKTRAERWLVQAYSQGPARSGELKRLLDVYLRDPQVRQRILSEVEKNSKTS